MRIVAFAGPSVPAEARAAFPRVEWRGPAEAGDFLHLPTSGPLTICLIDGYFDHRPAVRHKEILLLLSEGRRVVGGASIGALRAVEMEPFGMEGAGSIYRAYARGLIDGDDEVALAHGPEEWEWRPLSVPLVEVRATLCRAVRMGAIAPADARCVREAAGEIHYVERTWEAVSLSLPPRLVESARPALAGIHVPLKTLDAVACLRAATTPPPRRRRPKPVSTIFLHALMDQCGIDPATRPRARSRGASASSPAGTPTGTDCG